MKRTLIALGVLLALVAPAAAQTCLPHVRMTGWLEVNKGQARVAAGITRTGRLMELFSGDDGWTLVISTPAGRACVLDAGRDLVIVPPVTGDPT